MSFFLGFQTGGFQVGGLGNVNGVFQTGFLK